MREKGENAPYQLPPQKKRRFRSRRQRHHESETNDMITPENERIEKMIETIQNDFYRQKVTNAKRVNKSKAYKQCQEVNESKA